MPLLFATALAGSSWAAAGLTAAATLARPEGLLVLLVLGSHQLLRARRGEGRSWLPWLLVGGGPYALLLGFRRWYYGDWLPNTYYAKNRGRLGPNTTRGLDYLRDYAADHEGLLLLVGLAIFALLRRPAEMRLVAVGWLLFWLAVAWLGGDGLPMYRFALASLPLFAALAAACVLRLGAALAFGSPQKAGWPWR